MRFDKRFYLCFAGMIFFACGDEVTDLPPAPVVVRAEASTAECSGGGTVLRTGLDRNDDGILQDVEVSDFAVVCNGERGSQGTSGQDGLRTLLARADEAAGPNCVNGGERVDVGLDDNGDGTLDPGEIDATTYVCDGARGSDAPVLLTVTSTAVEAECSGRTGARIASGIDDNANGQLDSAEVDSSRLVCSGGDAQALVVVVTAVGPGTDCTAGGQRVRSGLDTNGDGLLQDTEVLDEDFICNLVSVLAAVTTLPVGDQDCPQGGQQIDVGTDSNNNGELETAEISSTTRSCNGAGGLRVLTRRTDEPAGTNCSAGGERLAVGLDTNGNRILDASEELTVTYTCDGAPGAAGANGGAVRVTAEPVGMNCPNGGTRIETGADADGDGLLSTAEVTATQFACNAGGTLNALTNVTPETPGMNCPNGGSRVEVGLDTDRSGTLDPSEVTSTSFICSNRAQVPIRITTATLPTAVPNTSYSGRIEAIGGVGGYTWSLAAGTLPAMLTLPPGGTPFTTLTGQVLTRGTSSFVIRVTDLLGNTSTRAFTLEAITPLTLEAAALPPLRSGAAYSATLQAVGGTPPYSFAVVDSILPPGLSLNAAGALSGTPSSNYGRRFLVEVTDAAGGRARGAYEIRGAREFVAYCGDFLVNGSNDLVLARIGPTRTSTGVVTPLVGGSRIDLVCSDIAFSPTADQIAVVGDDGGGSEEVYLIDFSAFPRVTTTRVSPMLTSSTLDVTEIRWSPDGRYLAYLGDVNSASVNELTLADVSNPASVTRTTVNGTLVTSGDVNAFAFSPDSRRLIYRADERRNGQEELFAFDVPNLINLGVINGTLATTSDDVDNDFEISGDSRYVLYAAEQDSGGVTELYVARIDGATLGPSQKVNPPFVSGGDIGETNFPSDDDYSFSPTGEQIAYVADQDTASLARAYLVQTSAPGTSRTLSPPTGSGLAVVELAWDHLGRRVLLVGDLITNGVTELFVADTSNPSAVAVRVNDDLVSSGDVEASDYGFAPDDSYIYYEADQNTSSREELYLVFTSDVGRTPASRRLLGGTLSDSVAAVRNARSGAGLVFVADTNTTSTTVYELFAVGVSGGQVAAPVQINNTYSGTSQDVSTTQVQVTGEGRYILYISDEDVAAEEEVFLVDTLTQTKTQLNPSLPTSGDVTNVFVQEF